MAESLRFFNFDSFWQFSLEIRRKFANILFLIQKVSRILKKSPLNFSTLEGLVSYQPVSYINWIIHPLPAAEKREVRELEKCALKLAKSGCSLLFNGACLRENELPNN